MKRKLLITVLVLFIAIQFIRPKANNGIALQSTDYTHSVTVPPNIHQLLEKSCFDCHSNHTNYPWYSYINPVGLWLNHHIEEGKRELNFSDFASYNKKKMAHKLEEVAEQVEHGEMPLKSYTLIHTNAKLNEQERNAIIQWAKGEQARLNTP
jgi:hypothetical protein